MFRSRMESQQQSLAMLLTASKKGEGLEMKEDSGKKRVHNSQQGC